MLRRISDVLFRRPAAVSSLLLLVPPLLWLGVVYVGSLLALLAQSFFSIDEFSGLVDLRAHARRPMASCFSPPISTSSSAPCVMAAAVTLAARVIAFPIAYYAARYARGRWKALFYLARDAAAVVELPGRGLCLEADPRQGGHPHLDRSSKLHLAWLLDAVLALPVIGGPSLSISYIGTFLVFLYIWLPFMILPIAGGARARAGQPDRGLGRSRRAAPARPSAR